MIRTALTAFIIAVAAIPAAHAQQRTIYGHDGRVIARVSTDSQGTTTIYGADGKVVARQTGPARSAKEVRR